MKAEKKRTKLYKTEVKGFGFFVVLSLFFWSCQGERLIANTIIEQTLEVYGGLENWRNIDQLSFDKQVTLFLENGDLERKTDQFQLFQFQDDFGKIEWGENDKSHMIIYEDNKIFKIENDSTINSPVAIENAERAFFASEFVIKQPFDLLRDEVILTRENDTIINSKDCYVVSVSYKGDKPDADKWYYVIDKESFLILANKVVLKDHTSWVENLTYDSSSDFIFNAHRKSYRLDKDGNKTYLRAEYFYSNYLVNY